MKRIYTPEDFLTRRGRETFALYDPQTDYGLFNRFEARDQTSLSEHHAVIQDKQILMGHIQAYYETKQKPEKDITLPSGKTVSPDDIAKLSQTMVFKSYMDVIYTLEQTLGRADARKAHGVLEILRGEKAVPYQAVFASALKRHPAEATYIRLELNNPGLAMDSQLFDDVMHSAAVKLEQVDYMMDEGRARPLPRIGSDNGPRSIPLTDHDLSRLLNLWHYMDTQESVIRQAFLQKQGIEPGAKPN